MLSARQRKEILLQLFQAGVDAVGGVQATKRALSQCSLPSRVHLAAVGKAADAMTRGALNVLGDRLASGLVVTKHGHLSDTTQANSRLECIESGHPVPDELSLHAGVRLYDYVAALPAEEHLVFLVSGGASALVEYLEGDLNLQGLKDTTDELLASGKPIGEMNQQRRKLSRIKGGKLASVVNCSVTQLLISDVPNDTLGDIGSGLLVPDAATGMHEELPVWNRINTQIIASSDIAQAAVADAAMSVAPTAELTLQQPSGSLHGDMSNVVKTLTQTLTNAEPGIYIWGGEPTIILPPNPGEGGRNQHLALSLAKVAQQRESLSILVCGTDGTDGPTNAAGGLVDEHTLTLAAEKHLDVDQYLKKADAGTALQALDALVITGPTGTNVMDLCIAIID